MADTQIEQPKTTAPAANPATSSAPAPAVEKTDYLVDDPKGSGVVHVSASSLEDAVNQVTSKEQK